MVEFISRYKFPYQFYILDKKPVKKVGGVGLGNIFSGKPIELKTKDNNYNKVNSSNSAPPQPAIHMPSPPVASSPAHIILPKPGKKIFFDKKKTTSNPLSTINLFYFALIIILFAINA